MMASLLVSAGKRLDDARVDPAIRRRATVAAAVIGLITVWFHWIGFVLGGALVALVQPSIRRGLLAGLGFGVLSWIAFAVWLATMGDLTLYLGMGQVVAVSAVIPPVGGLLGSLARGVR